MNAEVKLVTLRDVCSRVDYGYTAKAGNVPIGPKFLRITDIVPDSLNWDEVPFCEADNNACQKYRLDTGDIVVARTGATVGYAKLIKNPPSAVFASYLVRFRVRPDVDAGYVGSIVQSQAYKEWVKSQAGGSAQPNANAKTLGGYQLPLPPLETQQRIAAILGAYDDLIEVNRRRVAVLEEMARGLFEEWFVRFRFPGHEAVSILDTPDGSLPEGWRKLPVSRAFDLLWGRSYRSADLVEDGGKPFVNLKCIARGGGFRIDGIKRYAGDYKPMQIVRRGDIVMAVTDMTQQRLIVGRVGRVPWLEEPEAVISMDLVKVDPAPQTDREFIYCWLRFSDFGPTAAQHANGANVLHLSPKAVTDFPIVMPDVATQEDFGDQVRPIFAMVETLAVTERYLAASRDLLLPRLISGQLSVETAERELEAA